MERVYAAFGIVPLCAVIAVCLIACIVNGSAAFILFLPMLIIVYVLTGLLALPLFFVLKKLKWLQWWHAALAGLIVSGAFVWVFANGINPYNVEIYGYSEFSIFFTIGFFIAVAFWLAAIFRNHVFPFVSSRFPITLLIIGFVVLLTAFLIPEAYSTADTKGEITAILPAVDGKPMVQVKLKTGESVPARVMCYGHYLPGRKVYIVYRKKFLLVSEGYWVDGLMDAKNAEELLDTCDNGVAGPIRKF